MADDDKIFVDEGWKAQVEKEREAAEKIVEEVQEEQHEMGELPEASFSALMGSLATQTMFALGVIAPPGVAEEEVMVDLDQARFTLDMLLILEQKTDGNLTEEEATQLAEARSELEQVYEARVLQFQEQNSGGGDTGDAGLIIQP